MTKKRVVDELRTRRALAEFDRQYPDGIPPTTPQDVQAMLGGPRLGRPPVDDPKVTVTLRLPGSTLAELDAAITSQGIRRQDALREAVEAWLRRARRRATRRDQVER